MSKGIATIFPGWQFLKMFNPRKEAEICKSDRTKRAAPFRQRKSAGVFHSTLSRVCDDTRNMPEEVKQAATPEQQQQKKTTQSLPFKRNCDINPLGISKVEKKKVNK